jgi:pimeloyl-ACP methyl ester carboxylesterase
MMEEGSRGHFVEAAGVRLHCLEWGLGGEPLVLVPGWGQSAHVFGELAPLLAAGRRVVAVTPRAHGHSATPAEGYTLAAVAGELAAAMDALGIDRAILVAHSLGASVATRLAADHPRRVARLVLLDGVNDYAERDAVMARNPHPAPPWPLFGTRAEQREWMQRYALGFWNDALEADLATRPGLAEESRRLEGLAAMLHDAAAHPQPFAELRCPVLALMAAESVESQFPWLDPADADGRRAAEAYLRDVREPWRRAAVDRFTREARHGRVVEISGGHYFYLSSRDRVADEIRAFLLTPSPSEAS